MKKLILLLAIFQVARGFGQSDNCTGTVPTLTVGAKYDTMDPKHMEWISTEVQNGRFLYCPNGSHCSQYDDQEHYFPGVIQFLKDVDNGTFKKIKS